MGISKGSTPAYDPTGPSFNDASRCRTCSSRKMVIYRRQGSTLLGYTGPYIDAQGVHHDHDPNWHSIRFQCSCGNQWEVGGVKIPCPGCDE